MTWRGTILGAIEPPASVLAVQDEHGGHIMDRLPQECMWCMAGHIWRWRHNGKEDCWMDMDGIGPYTEVPPLS